MAVEWFTYPVQGHSTLTPFIFNHQQRQMDLVKRHQELVENQNVTLDFLYSSVGLLAHHRASAVAAANQNSRRESNDDSPMVGVVIQQ